MGKLCHQDYDISHVNQHAQMILLVYIMPQIVRFKSVSVLSTHYIVIRQRYGKIAL